MGTSGYFPFKKSALVLAAVFSALTACLALAQDYPSKPIRLVVPYPPAGASDILARPIVNEMSKSIGQPIVLDFKPGGGSSIGADLAAKSAPDGYTIVMLLPAHAANATLIPKLPYDTIRDFVSVTLLASTPLVIEVNSQSSIRTMRELISAAKANPGKLNYASSGIGNASHLAIELLKSTIGFDLVHIPYKGSGPAKTALLAAEVDVLCDGLGSSQSNIQAGQFRALAVTTAARSKVFPDVPTVQELGLGDYDAPTWFGIFAPARTPAPILQKLNAEFIKAMAVPSVKERIETNGFQIVGSTPSELDALLKSEVARWGKVIKDANIKVD